MDHHPDDSTPEPQDHRSFGVFKPVGHVVISFETAARADDAQRRLAEAGIPAADVHRYSDREMLERIDADLAHASPLAAIGQELNLARAQRELAAQGYHWLVVRAADDASAQRIADAARRAGAERAQHYGRFVIEELIERPGNLRQSSESPERGLDAQTPSGRETEARELRREAGEGGGSEGGSP